MNRDSRRGLVIDACSFWRGYVSIEDSTSTGLRNFGLDSSDFIVFSFPLIIEKLLFHMYDIPYISFARE